MSNTKNKEILLKSVKLSVFYLDFRTIQQEWRDQRKRLTVD
jgi:hypothetical protein